MDLLMDINTLHIIHDKDNLKRYDRLMNELKEQGIENYYLWDAVHDKRSTFQGINKAHKQIILWAKENDLPYVTIAEDDVWFTCKGAYQYFLNNEPKDYDIYLSSIFLGEINENNETTNFTGLSLYKCNKRYYDIFLSADENQHIDIALNNSGKFVVCNPFSAIQHNGYSTNEKRYMNYSFMFKHRNMLKIV
jgi:hypothetical protein